MTFHALEGATHGYDYDRRFAFQCCGGRTVEVAPSRAAVEATKAIIEKALRGRWGL